MYVKKKTKQTKKHRRRLTDRPRDGRRRGRALYIKTYKNL